MCAVGTVRAHRHTQLTYRHTQLTSTHTADLYTHTADLLTHIAENEPVTEIPQKNRLRGLYESFWGEWGILKSFESMGCMINQKLNRSPKSPKQQAQGPVVQLLDKKFLEFKRIMARTNQAAKVGAEPKEPKVKKMTKAAKNRLAKE